MIARPAMLLVAIWLQAHLQNAVTSALLLGTCALFGSGVTRQKANSEKPFKGLSMKAISSSSYYPPQKESGGRQMRRLLEAKVRARFLDGEDLEKLRANISVMKEKMQYLKVLYASTGESIDTDDFAMALRDAIERSEKRDPDIEYIRKLAALESAKREYRNDGIAQIKEEAMMIRQCIPRLNLQGLWIAESTSSKPLMVNITYVGDNLLATAIAMHGKLPKGEVLLKADLSYMKALDPIRVSGEVAEKWGREMLTLYPGKAQSDHASNSTWVHGHFFMCKEDVFGFLILPTKQHIIFRRPQAKQIFNMIQDGIIKDKELKQMGAYLERCYKLTYTRTPNDDGFGITFRQLKRWSDEIE